METGFLEEVYQRLLGRTSNSGKMKSFKDVQEFLGNIDYINSGGCGIAAYSMYLWLRKNNKLPKDFKIVYLHAPWDNEEWETNTNFLNGNGSSAAACNHAIVQMDGKYVDSEGDYDPSGYALLGIDAENIDRFMLNSLNQPRWNRTFARAKHLPYIEEELGIDLSKVQPVLQY